MTRLQRISYLCSCCQIRTFLCKVLRKSIQELRTSWTRTKLKTLTYKRTQAHKSKYLQTVSHTLNYRNKHRHTCCCCCYCSLRLLHFVWKFSFSAVSLKEACDRRVCFLGKRNWGDWTPVKLETCQQEQQQTDEVEAKLWLQNN